MQLNFWVIEKGESLKKLGLAKIDLAEVYLQWLILFVNINLGDNTDLNFWQN